MVDIDWLQIISTYFRMKTMNLVTKSNHSNNLQNIPVITSGGINLQIEVPHDISRIPQSLTEKQSILSPHKFVCELCDYKCDKQSYYDKHLHTKKHEKNSGHLTINKEYKCVQCDKSYNKYNSFWQHKKRCKVIDISGVDETHILKQLLLEVIKNNNEIQKQNQLFAQQILDQNTKNLCAKHNITITNNNNNKFNINVFLHLFSFQTPIIYDISDKFLNFSHSRIF